MPFGDHSTQNPFSEALLRSGHQGCLRQSHEAEAGGSFGCYWALEPMASHWLFQRNQPFKSPAITASTSTPNLLPQEVGTEEPETGSKDKKIWIYDKTEDILAHTCSCNAVMQRQGLNCGYKPAIYKSITSSFPLYEASDFLVESTKSLPDVTLTSENCVQSYREELN